MADRLVSPSSGKTLIPVASRTTTPSAANAVKPIHVDREFVEVVIFDSMLHRIGSQFGHAAIEIDGVAYSRAHSKYFKGSMMAYLRGNAKIRDAVGVLLWVSEREKLIIRDELERRVLEDAKYSLFSNSCSTNVADVLELVGILAHDPRGLPTPVSPADLLAVLSKSNRFVKKRFYKEGHQGGASADW